MNKLASFGIVAGTLFLIGTQCVYTVYPGERVHRKDNLGINLGQRVGSETIGIQPRVSPEDPLHPGSTLAIVRK